MQVKPLVNWPYPFWIAHRGAGTLAPENTMAAFRLGAQYGYRMFECDAKISADGVVFLLHDTELARTTNGEGVGGDLPWEQLASLDAGSWHSSAYAQERLPTLELVAEFCLAAGYFLNIEIKPTPGTEHRTGEAVAILAQDLWKHNPVPPLLTSFKPQALQAALQVAPELPRGLLLSAWQEDAVALAQSLQCVAMVCQHDLWSAARVQHAHHAGLKVLSYTVNDAATVDRLVQLETDGIITDRVDIFTP